MSEMVQRTVGEQSTFFLRMTSATDLLVCV